MNAKLSLLLLTAAMMAECAKATGRPNRAARAQAKGKNLKNIIAGYDAPAPGAFTAFDKAGTDIINKKLLDYVLGKSDMNTLLREAEEEHNKSIASQLAK